MKKFILIILINNFYFTELFSQSFQKELPGYVYDALVKSNDEVGVQTGSHFLMFDSTGNIRWASFYNDQYSISSGEESNDGSVILCGSSCSLANVPLCALVVLKKDSLGETVWSNVLYDTNDTNYYSYVEGTLPYHNGIIIYGRKQVQYSFICYIDSGGSLVWGKKFNFCSNYQMRVMKTKYDEFIIIADYRFIKLNSSGNLVWSKSNIDILSYAVTEGPNGNYTLIVETDSTPHGRISIINTDTSGSLINGKIYYSNISFTSADDIKYLSDSSLEILGSTMENTNSVCQFAFLHLNNLQMPIIGSYLEISERCNTPTRLKVAKNGFVATGIESTSQESYIIKVQDPDYIECAVQYQFFSDNFSANYFLDSTIYTTEFLTAYPFVDSSYLSSYNPKSYCGTTQIPSIQQKDIIIFPNPFLEFFVIENIPENSEINVMDILGKKIPARIQQIDNKKIVKIFSDFPEIYFVSIRSGNNFIIKKIIKMN